MSEEKTHLYLGLHMFAAQDLKPIAKWEVQREEIKKYIKKHFKRKLAREREKNKADNFFAVILNHNDQANIFSGRCFTDQSI